MALATAKPPAEIVRAFRESFKRQATDELRDLTHIAAIELRRYWVEIASAELASSKDQYVKAIGQPVVLEARGRFTVTIELGPGFPTMIEEGSPPFDMKPKLLAGRAYRVIQFQHASSTAKSSRRGTPIGAAYRDVLGGLEAGRLGHRVYRAAARLVAQEAPPEVEGKRRLGPGAGGVEKLREHHVVDLYAGMIRRAPHEGPSPPAGPAGAGRGATRYLTYRTVSESSEGWIFPGLQARNFIPRVEEKAGEIFTRAVVTQVGR